MRRRIRIFLTAAVLAAPLSGMTVRGDDAKPSQAEVLRRVEQAVPGFKFKAIKEYQWFEEFRHRITGTDAAGHPVTVVATARGNVVQVATWFDRDPTPDLDTLIQIAARFPEMWERVTRIVRTTKADGHVSEWRLMGIEMETGKEKTLAVVAVDKPELEDRDKPE